MHLLFATVGKDDVEHIKNNRQVAKQQRTTQNTQAAKKFAHFPWKQQTSGNQRDPLCPRAPFPEAIGFSETQNSVGEGYASGVPEAGVSDAVGKIEKNLSYAAIGVDVEQGQQSFGQQPDIFVQERDSTDSHRYDKDTFEQFKSGYSPKHTPLTAVLHWLGSGLVHV
jgi:hypothetical protein